MHARNLMTIGLIAIATFAGLGVSTMLPGPAATLPIPLAIHTGADQRLAAHVGDLLKRDGGLIDGDIGVVAEAGVVTVSGYLPDEGTIRRALELAGSVPGVREVRNAIVPGRQR